MKMANLLCNQDGR